MDFTADVIISVFLIVVIAGFVITFITQTFHIFRKMLAFWIRRRRKVSFLGVALEGGLHLLGHGTRGVGNLISRGSIQLCILSCLFCASIRYGTTVL
jgi:hypothetical protein